ALPISFLKAVREPGIRDGLTSQALMKVLSDPDARGELTVQLRGTLATQAVSQAAATAVHSAEARTAVANLLSDLSMKQMFANQAVRSAIANPEFQMSLLNH